MFWGSFLLKSCVFGYLLCQKQNCDLQEYKFWQMVSWGQKKSYDPELLFQANLIIKIRPIVIHTPIQIDLIETQNAFLLYNFWL